MKVSVIIVNYKTCSLLRDCLESLYRETAGVDFEVIVVDNDSNDGSQQMVESEFPQMQYIESGANLGFGKANNLGYEHAAGEYIFLLNSDTVLLNNAIKILADFLDTHPQVAIAGGQLYDADNQESHSYELFAPGLKFELDVLTCRLVSRRMLKRRQKFAQKNGYFPVSYISGADMMLRRKVIEECGMFDPDFFLYFEETEMTHRHRRLGISAFVPRAKIVHLEGKSMATSSFRESNFHKSRVLYYQKCHNNFHTMLSNIVYRTYLLSRIGLYSLKRNEPVKSQFRMMYKALKESKTR